MENKIYELLLKIQSEIQETKIEMKQEFETFHKRIDGLENQMLNGFRETKLHVDNRNKEKELMIDFL